MTIQVTRLDGIRTRPLAGYLKALGVLRLVAEQRDPHARGAWEQGIFTLRSTLDRDALARFFLEEYIPTPVTTPWNGDAGFRLKKRPGAAAQVEAIEASESSRFEAYRRTLAAVRHELARHPGRDLDAFKDELKVGLRSRLPEEALAWYDAVLVLTEEGRSGFDFGYSPLFGSGGNDGSQDFSKGFLQALEATMEFETGAPTRSAARLLDASLFGQPVDKLSKDTAGQYAPSSTGGLNATAGMDGPSLTNPWDVILLLEGAMVFAASATRKLDGEGVARTTFPFTVRAISAGYASAADKDTSGRAFEIWLPVWSSPTSMQELRVLMREGRVTQGQRRVRTATDFAVALGRLGVDRGVSAFERFGVYERNGNNYYATPLGAWRVPRQPRKGLTLLDDHVLSWIEEFRRVSGDKAPASLQRARRDIERTLLEFAERDDATRLIALLAALGRAERTVWRTGKMEELRRGPVPLVSEKLVGEVLGRNWKPEHRLAAASAAVDLRFRRAGVRLNKGGKPQWVSAGDPDVAWTSPALDQGLEQLVMRRALDDARGCELPADLTVRRRNYSRKGDTSDTKDVRTSFSPRSWRAHAPLSDVVTYLHAQLDPSELVAALDAFVIVEPLDIPRIHERPPNVPALFALMAPVVHRRLGPKRWSNDASQHILPATPGVVERALAGDGVSVTKLCCARLRGAGVRLHVEHFPVRPQLARRCARALAFPLSDADLGELVARIGDHPTVDTPEQESA